jgi:hypothetical protein
MHRRRRRSERVLVTSWFQCRATLAGASFLIATAASATPQVVGDEACERYEVDMASFASCTDGKVVRPAPDATHIPIAAANRSHYAVYFAPDVDHRAIFLLAAVMPGFTTPSGERERPDYSTGCASAP